MNSYRRLIINKLLYCGVSKMTEEELEEILLRRKRIHKGYIRIRTNQVEKRLHRVIVEHAIGRPLLFSEIVHHKDGNTLNNSPDNLEAMTRAGHSMIHKYWEKSSRRRKNKLLEYEANRDG